MDSRKTRRTNKPLQDRDTHPNQQVYDDRTTFVCFGDVYDVVCRDAV